MRHPHLLCTGLTLTAGLLAPLDASADTSDPACIPASSVVGWSAPKNVSIRDDAAVRWPIDATVRLGFSGPWCPDLDTISLVSKKTGEAIPAQVRIAAPSALLHNEPTPLSMIDVDPLPELDRSADYIITIKPSEPALPMYGEFAVEFRTARRAMEPWPEYAGVDEVIPARDNEECWGQKIFGWSDSDDQLPDPPCVRERRLELKVAYTPIDRPEALYAIYRTRSIPLDGAGLPKPDDPTYDDEPTLVGYEPGAVDQGNGIPRRTSPYAVAYHVLPRQECFSVVMVDEWGRELGDRTADKCLTIPVLEPCPLPNGDEQQYPPPNEFEIRTPVPGMACDGLCLGGGDCEHHIPPPIGQEPDAAPPDAGAGGAPGDAGAGGTGGAGGGGASGGATADAGPGAGADGGSGGGSCQASPGRATASGLLLLAALAGLGLRRARRIAGGPRPGGRANPR